MPSYRPHSLLLEGISQYEVDFVIPKLGVDLPLGIDPFLLFKSRNPELAELHQKMVSAFNHGIDFIAKADDKAAKAFFDFPEVEQIGFGYTKESKQGSGVGDFLGSLIIETLREAPALRERGIRHIEEMQLVSVGIAQDRTSDIAANLIKQYLVSYTQKQCDQLGIPLAKGVPLEHIFDFSTMSWYDDYVDLPISPVNKAPLLFVPRRIVRALPWINYNDYLRLEFAAYLRAKRVKEKAAGSKGIVPKTEIVFITRGEVERIDSYIDKKEEAASAAQPTLSYLDEKVVCEEVEALKNRIANIRPGRKGAGDYQRVILDTFNLLFNPQLTDGEMEVQTIEGVERRDIIFTNESDETFWAYTRTEHSSFLVMLEIKNTQEVDMNHLNQTATYLGDRLGHLGFIVTRNSPGEGQVKKAISIYNQSTPRKIILILTDEDIFRMLDGKCKGDNPTRYIQNLYRRFRTDAL